MEDDEDFAGDWEAALLFLSASLPSPTLPLAHATAMTAACPIPLLEKRMQFQPEQALLYDEFGNTPLLYAASTHHIQEPENWDTDEDGFRSMEIERELVTVRLDLSDLENYDHLAEQLTEDSSKSALLLVVNLNLRAA
jgi:hypothetical protein